MSHGSGVMGVLVTGSSGRVGRAICECLSAEHEVVGLDRLPSATTTLVGDITDPEVLARAVRGVDAVVHVAALHAPHVGAVADAEFERVNRSGRVTSVGDERDLGWRPRHGFDDVLTMLEQHSPEVQPPRHDDRRPV